MLLRTLSLSSLLAMGSTLVVAQENVKPTRDEIKKVDAIEGDVNRIMKQMTTLRERRAKITKSIRGLNFLAYEFKDPQLFRGVRLTGAVLESGYVLGYQYESKNYPGELSGYAYLRPDPRNPVADTRRTVHILAEGSVINEPNPKSILTVEIMTSADRAKIFARIDKVAEAEKILEAKLQTKLLELNALQARQSERAASIIKKADEFLKGKKC